MGGRHVDERQRHELGESAGLLLQRPGAHEVPGPVTRLLDRAEHDRDVRAQADAVGDPVHLQPLLGVDLVRAQDRPGLVVEDLGSGAGQRAKARVPKPQEVGLERLAESPGSFVDLERGEGVDVDALGAGSHGPQHLEVVLAVEARVDPPLETDLGGALLLGFDDAPCDLVDLEQVWAAAQVERQGSLGEGAEPALERADVRVVDVPVGDEGHRVADGDAPHLVCDLGDGAHLWSSGREEDDDLVLSHLLTRERSGEHLGNCSAASRQPGSRRSCRRWCRRCSHR